MPREITEGLAKDMKPLLGASLSQIDDYQGSMSRDLWRGTNLHKNACDLTTDYPKP